MLYMGIFVAAEAAFVLMAIKEYLQDYLRLEDAALIVKVLETTIGTSEGPGPI